jgi:hypothetical protein
MSSNTSMSHQKRQRRHLTNPTKLNSTTTKIPFVCMFTYEQRNEPIGPFLRCSMCIYIHRKMRSGPIQNGLDQSRIWTACPDILSRFFDPDSHVPLSGPDLDQILTKSGIGQKLSVQNNGSPWLQKYVVTDTLFFALVGPDASICWCLWLGVGVLQQLAKKDFTS